MTSLPAVSKGSQCAGRSRFLLATYLQGVPVVLANNDHANLIAQMFRLTFLHIYKISFPQYSSDT